jgi:Mg2+ and Co2+ transporter CorA
MDNPSEIEKINLEAHSELCVARYGHLKSHLDDIHQRIDDIEDTLKELRDLITEMKDARYNQVITWSMGMVATLLAAVGFLAFYIMTHAKLG